MENEKEKIDGVEVTDAVGTEKNSGSDVSGEENVDGISAMEASVENENESLDAVADDCGVNKGSDTDSAADKNTANKVNDTEAAMDEAVANGDTGSAADENTANKVNDTEAAMDEAAANGDTEAAADKNTVNKVSDTEADTDAVSRSGDNGLDTAEGNGGNPDSPLRPRVNEMPNAAAVLNSYLFATDDTKNIKPPKKESPAFKKLMKSLCLILLTLAVSFSGAFACVYWVCNTALLGDSDFFRAVMLQGSGITVNKVELDMISGNYEEDTIALAEKISQYAIDIYVRDADGNKLGSGSGVIISEDGLAVTNYHVVYTYEKNSLAVLPDGTVCEMSVLHLDKISDLAVIKIKTDKKLTPVTIGDSTKLKKGQSIAVYGNPLGLSGTVSFGKVGHPDRDLGDIAGNYVQVDASVNRGNSGCGVYDAAGNLIGIINSKATGTNVDGIGYAIPSSRVLDVINQLFDKGYVSGRPAIGFTLVQVNQSTWDYFKNGDGTNPGELSDYLYEAKYGIYIIESRYTAGIIKGDRIVSCNGIAFDNRENFSEWLMKYKPGDTVRITVERVQQPVEQNSDGSYNVVRQQIAFECVLHERDWADEPYYK